MDVCPKEQVETGMKSVQSVFLQVIVRKRIRIVGHSMISERQLLSNRLRDSRRVGCRPPGEGGFLPPLAIGMGISAARDALHVRRTIHVESSAPLESGSIFCRL